MVINQKHDYSFYVSYPGPHFVHSPCDFMNNTNLTVLTLSKTVNNLDIPITNYKKISLNEYINSHQLK